MDYFTSSGLNTIQPTNTINYNNQDLPLSTTMLDNINEFIPSEITSSIDLTLTWIIFFRVLIIIWVLKDSNYRSSSSSFCLLSIILVTIWTPIIWLPIYLAIRPLGYKHERNYRKTISENIENNEIIIGDDEKANIEDEQHLADLREKAKLAEKRVKRTVIAKKTTTRKINTKTPSTKTRSSRIPTAKKATVRTIKNN